MKTINTMHIHPLWSDDYWPLVISLYFQKPEGVKPSYSRPLVDLSLQLHVPQGCLRRLMAEVASPATPRLRRLVAHYGRHPVMLRRDAARLLAMRGFGNAGAFYEGVAVDTGFEARFRPVADDTVLTPAMLTVLLDLYFRLTPLTMTAQTPEVASMATALGISAGEVVDVLGAFLAVDPCVRGGADAAPWLVEACRTEWRRTGGDPHEAARQAGLVGRYFGL